MIAAYAGTTLVSTDPRFSFAEIKDFSFISSVPLQKNPLIPWDGNGYHAGVFTTMFTAYAEQVPEDYIETDSMNFHVRMSDIYNLSTIESSKEFEDFYPGSFENSESCSLSFSQNRGGTYIYAFDIDKMSIHVLDTIVVVDEPSIYSPDLGSLNVGEDLDATFYLTTGYPFDMDALTGNEYVTYKIYSVVNDSTKIETGNEGSKSLRLKDEAHPLLAGLDSISVEMFEPAPGKYCIQYESNWSTANIAFDFDVNDTISVSTKLDKDVYTYDTDKTAKLSVHASYGYPFIPVTKEYPIPTVTIATKIMDTADSLVIANDTLATKALNYDGTLDIDLSKVTSEYLTENKDSVALTLDVLFNGKSMYNKSIPIVFSHSSTGIEKPKTDGTGKHSIYTLSGVKQNCEKESLPNGVYIIDGKKQVVKK